MFEDVALGVGGADFYKKAFVELDQATLTARPMVKVFDTFRKIQRYIDKTPPGRDWNLATAMVINGKAGMQFMGDWAKGEFAGRGQEGGHGLRLRGRRRARTRPSRSTSTRSCCSSRRARRNERPARLAKTIMSPEFQELFNLNKGSIPVRLGVKMRQVRRLREGVGRRTSSPRKAAAAAVARARHGRCRRPPGRDQGRRHEVHELDDKETAEEAQAEI